MLDYETLRIIWWLLLGFLFIGFAIMGGIDLGCGILLRLIAKTDIEKRVIINSIGPTWEGNQVWFIVCGGATFAAWPYLYSIAFSTLYSALFLVLVALIMRPVGFDFRNKINNSLWRNVWDHALFIGGFVPTLVFGMAFGNLMHGLSFGFDKFMFVSNRVELLSLFTPFTLLCGLLSVTLLTTQAATFLMMKTSGTILYRSIILAYILPIISIVLFLIGGFMISEIEGYKIIKFAGTASDSNPLTKVVMVKMGAWLENYKTYPWIKISPILGFAGAAFVIISAILRKGYLAFIGNSISIIGVISTVGFSMFPFILPSNLDYNSSLTIWDASSSQHTLFLMLIAVLIFMPIILIYTSWAYKVMFGRIDEDYINKKTKDLY